MDFVFLDTNALIKLYISETGSSWLVNFVSGKQKFISELTWVEAGVTFSRLYRDGRLSKQTAASNYAGVWKNRANYKVIPLDISKQRSKIITLAFNLPIGLGLRSLDALQITAANLARTALITGTSFIFISSDDQLLRVAQSQGFTTENPEDHP